MVLPSLDHWLLRKIILKNIYIICVAFYFLPPRFLDFSGSLAMRKMLGVTSKISSWARNSTHASRDMSIGGSCCLRMLVTAFVLHTFTSKSSGRWWILTLHATQERKNKESEWRVRLSTSAYQTHLYKTRKKYKKFVMFFANGCSHPLVAPINCQHAKEGQ